MQIENVGPYQLHLIAHELSAPNTWDPFVEIYRFDEAMQDFRCVQEKQRASAEPCASYEEAIERAREAGNALVRNWQH
ncbi:hypothetical protein [Noviherbaspirillum galbum]|uniref:Uncharacterized protein n=1 Tax=Noviherbaspirillum galbum TaxID=2709383 RepID=A0A6B3SFL2_9BURK|nr:hypothetical protein [Noviherbaspirillum galbum]NEX59644.1 hypothetical protein [Noviherbaspirillum galbum]